MGETADSGVPHGAILSAFVEATIGGDAAVIAVARGTVRRALGGAALVDAAAAIASFDAVVKIADGTGIPLEPDKAERTRDIRAALGIDAFRD